MKSTSSSRRQSKLEYTLAASPKTEVYQGSAIGGENKDALKSQGLSSRESPLKHSRSTVATGKFSESPSKSGTPVPNVSGVPTAALSATASRPESPATAVSRNSDSPAPRQARVLRVVDTTRTETPSVASAATSIRRSRKPSISSVSRSDTPADNGSEYDLYTSTSVSRANSPPPNRVGSAPVRTMTKSQAKKERKLKAKQAEEAKKEEAQNITTPVEEPVQAPIIGRKRKTKKAPASSADKPGTSENGISDIVQATSKAGKEARDGTEQRSDGARKSKSKDKSGKDAKGQQTGDEKTGYNGAQKPAVEEAWRSNNTLEQMIKDAEATGVALKDLFVERTSPLPTILAQLHQSGELDLNTHTLINPPNLNQRADMRCVAEDFDMLKQSIELTEENRKQLLRGDPVRVNANSGFLKNRCLITPAGCILRHLSFEEEERYLALEKSLASNEESFQEYPSTSITEPDVTNRGGGLDALFATPEKFGICWVDEAPRTGLTSDSTDGPVILPDPCPTGSASIKLSHGLSALEDSSRSMSWTMGNTSDIVSATAASVRSFAAATAKQMIGGGSNGNSGGSNGGSFHGFIRPADIDDIISMSDDELKIMIEESQREVEISRKDVDVVDKKFMTLVKRNKKLAHQALGVAAELGYRGSNGGAGSGKVS